jgi:acetolactate synthase-1/2/3 large subunit
MQSPSITGAKHVLSILEKQNVTDIFGYPGGAIMPLYDALYDSPIHHFLCRHEQGAALAAIGYARASKKTGVCLATSGPGATNLLTGLAEAMADSVPLVAITGQVSTMAMGTDAFQEIDIIGLSLACTKHSFQIHSIELLDDALNKAFEIAHSGRPGSVLIDIPKNIQMTSYSFPLNDSEHHSIPTSIKSSYKTSNKNDYQKAAELILLSESPIFYVGGGIGLSDSSELLREVIEFIQIPSVETLKALGSVDFNDPLYLGMLGMHGTKAANLSVQKSDLLIVCGARFDDRVTGKLAEFAPQALIIHLDIDPAEINKRRKADIALVGDLKETLTDLFKALQSSPLIESAQIQQQKWREACIQRIQAFHPETSRSILSQMSRLLPASNQKSIDASYKKTFNANDTPIFAPALLNELSGYLKKDAIVTTDVGQHQMWAAQTMHFSHPTRFISSCGLGTMGFGVPAAIGAQVSLPDVPVICITGDGSFIMNIQELATIKRYHFPV